jgi:hypothetical protein
MNASGLNLAAGAVALVVQLATTMAWADERELRDVGEFDSISVGGGVDLHVAIGDTFSVEVESDNPERISTRVRGDTLEIGYDRPGLFGFNFGWGDGGDVHVTLPELRSLSAGGGSDVESVGTITGESLEISASGGSDINVAIAVNELDVATSGGSDVELTGSARFASVTSSGGSDFDATDFTTSEADLRSSGGSDVRITVSDRLVARASGGSDITYRGQPAEVDVSSSGGADIRGRQ